jgi:hypothetical protein
MSETSNGSSVTEFFDPSPFSNVADETSAGCWAGRPVVHESLTRLQRALSRMPDSSLDVMWANLGAGKTHTLLHLAYMLQAEGREAPNTVCVFLEMPEQVKNFHDLFRRITAALPLDRLAKLVGACPKGKLDVSLVRAANVLSHGGPAEKDVVREWLTGGRPALKDLKNCSGITHRIEDDIAASDILCGIVQAFSHSKVRLFILVDEFQRIGVLRPNARNKVLSCVRTVFSRTPTYFSMLFSIQSMVEQTALEFIPPELRTLLGKKPAISLPSMDQAEAKEFILARFAFFRSPNYDGGPTAPFLADAVDEILSFLQKEAKVPLSPREVIQAFAFVYGRAEAPEQGITGAEALRLLGSAYETPHE